jgi:nicotinamide-nucleotide amidase
MRAIIFSIGDELTLGQTLDSNSQWLSARLAERSIITIEHRTVADDRAALARAIADCAPRCDVLILTGGLGPTEDDLTREAMGDVVTPGEALVEDAAARDHLRDCFERRRRSMPPSNLRQALRPRTFRTLANPHGTAPGLAGEHAGCRIFCLPGPPREMRPMFDDHVLPALPAAPRDEMLLTAAVHQHGVGESLAAQKLGDLMRRDRNPLVGTTVSDSIVTARIRAGGSAEWARKQLRETVETIQRLWHPYAFGEGDITLAHALGDVLLQRDLHLATAESCTGGWLGKAIVDRAGSSAYYLGGWVTYSNEMKVRCLEVACELLERHGAVSAETARAMARGAMQRSGAECALAITGIAGPDGGTAEKPVGTVYIAAALRDFVEVRRFEFTGDRTTIRDRSVKAALQMMRFVLLDVAGTPLLWERKGDGEMGRWRDGERRRRESSTANLPASLPISPSPHLETALLALGSNLGDRHATLDAAISALRQTAGIEMLAVSAFIETEALGPDGVASDQPRYLNAAVKIQTTLAPRELLQACLAIEQHHGRQRNPAERWGSRTLDIDLLLYGERIIDEPGLSVPHPRLHERLFALQPASEVAGEMRHPALDANLSDLLSRLQQPA